MIQRTVSAALLLRDGFTGRAIPLAAAVLCALDGRFVRPVRKQEGYLVFLDLEPGEHVLSLRCPGYREESFPLTVPPRGAAEGELYLSPGAGYRFPADTASLLVTIPGAAGETLWTAMAGRLQLKLAQAKKGDGGKVLRLFCSGDPGWLPVPGAFLTMDKEGTELIRLLAVQGDTGELSAPMQRAHLRGTELRPALRFRTDGEGKARLLFPRGGEVLLFCRDQWMKTELAPGEQDLQWQGSGAS